jgi:hypothetical protein
MNKNDLRVELKRLGVPKDIFDLEGGHLSDRYTLKRNPLGGWCVYYSERGIEFDQRDFQSESQACEYLLHLLKRTIPLSEEGDL